MDAVELYLDLLKRCVTNTIFHQEPNADDPEEFRFVRDFTKHYIKGTALSMLPLARLNNIQSCAFSILRDDIPGDFIEAGVWRGGSAIFMRAILKAANVTDRTVWVADSFEGLPTPDPEQFPIEAKADKGAIINKAYGRFAVDMPTVQQNFQLFGLLDDQVRFLKGWFKDTLPTAPIDRLSLMRLDGDYYESTMDGLVNLYDKLSPGGYAVIDDYGEDSWTNCRKAVDEFRQDRGITEPMIQVDSKCYYWRRSR